MTSAATLTFRQGGYRAVGEDCVGSKARMARPGVLEDHVVESRPDDAETADRLDTGRPRLVNWFVVQT